MEENISLKEKKALLTFIFGMWPNTAKLVIIVIVCKEFKCVESLLSASDINRSMIVNNSSDRKGNPSYHFNI